MQMFNYTKTIHEQKIGLKAELTVEPVKIFDETYAQTNVWQPNDMNFGKRILFLHEF